MKRNYFWKDQLICTPVRQFCELFVFSYRRKHSLLWCQLWTKVQCGEAESKSPNYSLVHSSSIPIATRRPVSSGWRTVINIACSSLRLLSQTLFDILLQQWTISNINLNSNDLPCGSSSGDSRMIKTSLSQALMQHIFVSECGLYAAFNLLRRFSAVNSNGVTSPWLQSATMQHLHH